MIWLGYAIVLILGYVVLCIAVLLILGAIEHKRIDVLRLEERVKLRILRSWYFFLFVPLLLLLLGMKKLEHLR